MVEKDHSLDNFEAEQSDSKVDKQGANGLVDFVLMLAIDDYKEMIREDLGDHVDRINEKLFEYIGDIPTGIPVAENEIIYAFRLIGTHKPALLVATFNKNENGGPDLESFKGVRLFPDITKNVSNKNMS
jgi:hypothetical protein